MDEVKKKNEWMKEKLYIDWKKTLKERVSSFGENWDQWNMDSKKERKQ